jgi:hypothetical protein
MMVGTDPLDGVLDDLVDDAAEEILIHAPQLELRDGVRIGAELAARITPRERLDLHDPWKVGDRGSPLPEALAHLHHAARR